MRATGAGAPHSSQFRLGLSIEEAPGQDDQVVEDAGARVFIEAEVVSYLDDKILDAETVENRVMFSLAGQVEQE